MVADKTTMRVTGYGRTVDITFNKLEFDFVKNLIVQKIPGTQGSGSAHKDSDNLLIDLGWVTKTISITNGWLLSDSTTSSWQKKIDIEYMADRKGTITINWQENYPEGNASVASDVTDNEGNTGYTVSIIKYKITEVPGRVGDTTDDLSGNVTTGQTKLLMINIQFAVGKHMG